MGIEQIGSIGKKIFGKLEEITSSQLITKNKVALLLWIFSFLQSCTPSPQELKRKLSQVNSSNSHSLETAKLNFNLKIDSIRNWWDPKKLDEQIKILAEIDELVKEYQNLKLPDEWNENLSKLITSIPDCIKYNWNLEKIKENIKNELEKQKSFLKDNFMNISGFSIRDMVEKNIDFTWSIDDLFYNNFFDVFTREYANHREKKGQGINEINKANWLELSEKDVIWILKNCISKLNEKEKVDILKQTIEFNLVKDWTLKIFLWKWKDSKTIQKKQKNSSQATEITPAYIESLKNKYQNLRWTRDQKVKEEWRIRRLWLRKLQNNIDVEERLIKIIDTVYYKINKDQVDEPRRFLTSSTKKILETIAKEFYDKFHKPLYINSLARTVGFVKELRKTNPNASWKSAHMYGVAFDFQIINMTPPELDFLCQIVLKMEKQWEINAILEWSWSVCLHITDSKRWQQWQKNISSHSEIVQREKSNIISHKKSMKENRERISPTKNHQKIIPKNKKTSKAQNHRTRWRR
jgi:uncharacterized protein YcbK (DUF882 family)